MSREHRDAERLKIFACCSTHAIEQLEIAGQYVPRIQDNHLVVEWMPDDPRMSLVVQLWTPIPSIRLNETTSGPAKVVVIIADTPFVIDAGTTDFRHEGDPNAPLHPFWESHQWKPQWDEQGRPKSGLFNNGFSIDCINIAIREYVAWYDNANRVVRLRLSSR